LRLRQSVGPAHELPRLVGDVARAGGDGAGKPEAAAAPDAGEPGTELPLVGARAGLSAQRRLRPPPGPPTLVRPAGGRDQREELRSEERRVGKECRSTW